MAERCPECQGTGFELRTGDGGVVISAPCRCRADDRGAALLKVARIPRRYAHCTLDDFEVHDPSHETAIRAAREWIDQWPANSSGLLMLGGPGTGKTHLAVAIARALIDSKQVRVVFWEQRELLKALQGTFDSGASLREAQILGPVLDAEVLVLDDLGAGRTTPWARDVMHDIIAHRYNAELPLVMTSNLTTGDEQEKARSGGRTVDAPLSLRERLGDPLMSRLYEMCRILRLAGKDYRSWILHAKHRY